MDMLRTHLLKKNIIALSNLVSGQIQGHLLLGPEILETKIAPSSLMKTNTFPYDFCYFWLDRVGEYFGTQKAGLPGHAQGPIFLRKLQFSYVILLYFLSPPGPESNWRATGELVKGHCGQVGKVGLSMKHLARKR